MVSWRWLRYWCDDYYESPLATLNLASLTHHTNHCLSRSLFVKHHVYTMITISTSSKLHAMAKVSLSRLTIRQAIERHDGRRFMPLTNDRSIKTPRIRLTILKHHQGRQYMEPDRVFCVKFTKPYFPNSLPF